jgi:hypothetical protein
MANSSASIRRIAAFSAILALLVAALVGWRPLRYELAGYKRSREPVVVRPAVAGVVLDHGQPMAGIEVREFWGSETEEPSCEKSVPVARTDATGRFLVPATFAPRHLAPTGITVPWFCLRSSGKELAMWGRIIEPGETETLEVVCKFPRLSPHYEDGPCKVLPPNNSSKPTPLRGAA